MKYIKTGKIINTHGLKGELKIRSYSDFDDERYKKGNTVYIKEGTTYLPFEVATYRVHKGFPLVSFTGYANINDVEKYKEHDLFVEESSRAELPEGQFYASQLVGLSVLDEDGNKLGTVIDVEGTLGAQNNIRIRKNDGKEALIPNVPFFVKKISVEEKNIVIHVEEGLL